MTRDLDSDALLAASQHDLFWVPADTVVVDRPGLLYTVSPRDNPGLNRALRFRGPPGALDAAVAEVAEAHRGVVSRFQVMPPSWSPALERALDKWGYARGDVHDAYTLATSVTRPALASGLGTRRVTTLEELALWYRTVTGIFHRQHQPKAEELAGYFAQSSGPGARTHRFFGIDSRSGEPLSTGGLTVFPGLGFGFLWGAGTVPEARGRGAYSAVVTARLQFAASLGLARVGVFARRDSSGPILAAQGFDKHGEMTFWDRPPKAG